MHTVVCILEINRKFTLSNTVRRWVIVSTCQVRTMLEIKSDITLLPFNCFLKCKWLMFSQSSSYEIESFLWPLKSWSCWWQLLTDTEELLSWDENTWTMVEFCEDFSAHLYRAVWAVCELRKPYLLLFISLCLRDSNLCLHYERKDDGDDFEYLLRACCMWGAIPRVC